MLARAQLAVGAVLTALIASGCTAPSLPQAKFIRFEIKWWVVLPRQRRSLPTCWRIWIAPIPLVLRRCGL
jgi:hypothetical protein